MVSVLLKVMNSGVTDPYYLAKVDKLIEKNIDRFASSVMTKLAVLVLSQKKVNPRHKELLLRRLMYFNPENLMDVKTQSHLLHCIANLDN